MTEQPTLACAESVRLMLGSLAALVAIAALTFTPEAAAAGQDGMVAVRDPVTGQLRAPTAGELRALRALAPAAMQPGAPKGVLRIRPDGSGHMRLGDSAMVYSVLTRDPAGTSTVQCVHGQHAADAAAGATAQEHRHDDR